MGEGAPLPDFRRNGRNASVSQIIDPVTGRFHSPLTPLERFAAKCRFDPVTGCVVWIGGKTKGAGKPDGYGAFKDRGVRWLAHRWAAVHIHGIDLSGGLTVGHCCKHTANGHPDTLCVEHLEAQTLSENIAERNTRVAKAIRAEQTAQQKLFWLFVDRGIEPIPENMFEDPEGVPWFTAPAWFKPFEKGVDSNVCPF